MSARLEHDYDIIDCHHHYGSLQDSMGALPTALAPESLKPEDYDRIELETRLASMDAQGVRQAVVIGGHSYLRPDGLADTRRVNDGVAAYRDRLPERFPAAVGIVEPLYGEAGLPEIERARRELGLAGISFHVRFQGVSMDSPWVRRIVGEMLEFDLVPFLHAPWESPENALWKIETVAAAFPEAPMIVLDPFSSYEQTREAPYVAERCPNLIFDTSLAHSFGMVRPFIRNFGAERVVFGTDIYSLVPHGSHLLPEIISSDLDEADKIAVLGGNLRRILGLAPGGGAK